MKDNITQLQAKPQGDDDFMNAAHMMRAFGGGFASCIAQAYFAADRSNKERLKAAFPDLFTTYFHWHLERRNPLLTNE